MQIPIVFMVVLGSLTSIPFIYQLNKWNLMKNSISILIAGVISLTLVTAVPAWYIRRRYVKVDPIIYASITFSWSCVIDILVGLEFNGYIKNFMEFYFKDGEPYLFTVHGSIISIWDGTAHFAMYLLMIYLFCEGKSYREVGLYWTGSLLHSMIVFLPGSLLGGYDVTWACLLNVPYLLIPLFAGFKFLKDRPMHIKSYMHVPSILERPKDLMFILFFLGAIILSIFRGMIPMAAQGLIVLFVMNGWISRFLESMTMSQSPACAYKQDMALVRGLGVIQIALGSQSDTIDVYERKYEAYINDSSTYPKMQMIIYLFYFVLYYCCAIFGLLVRDQGYMTDWSIIHAGAAAQAQFAFIFGALHSKTANHLHPATTGLPAVWFWVINLALFIVPQLFVWRCKSDPDMFGRTYTIETAQPIMDVSGYKTPISSRKKEY